MSSPALNRAIAAGWTVFIDLPALGRNHGVIRFEDVDGIIVQFHVPTVGYAATEDVLRRAVGSLDDIRRRVVSSGSETKNDPDRI